MTQQDEIKVLFPNSSVTLSTGETIELKPFTFGQLPRALSMVKGVGSLIQQSRESDNPQAALIAHLSDAGEDLLQLVAYGTGKPRDWFDTLSADDGVALTSEFLAVNFDFFTKKVLPQINAGMEKFKPSQKPLLNSSAEASPTAT